MTSIHAPIPPHLKDAVLEAKRRGEENGSGPHNEVFERPPASRESASATSLVMKKSSILGAHEAARGSGNNASLSTHSLDLPEDGEEDNDTKENDPSHLPSAVLFSHESSRRNVLGKRPLSELPTPVDPEASESTIPLEGYATTGADQKTPPGQLATHDPSSEPVKKSPKLFTSARNSQTCGGLTQEDHTKPTGDIYLATSPTTDFGDDKENVENFRRPTSTDLTIAKTQQPGSQAGGHPERPTLRKVSNVGPSRSKGQARVGIRRL